MCVVGAVVQQSNLLVNPQLQQLVKWRTVTAG